MNSHIISADFYDLFTGAVYANSTSTSTTDLPAGEYKILLRALKITGDPKLESEYECE